MEIEMEQVVDDDRTRTGNFLYAWHENLHKHNSGDAKNEKMGTVWTATAYVTTALVGSGILTLPWSFAQLGWILGPLVLFLFAVVTYYTAALLCNCYRSPDPINGRRNYTYIDATRSCLGVREALVCGIIQYAILWGNMVGYTITAAMSMMSIKLTNCFHNGGQSTPCKTSGIFYTVIYGLIEIVLSQFPNLEKIAALSYLAAAMSFAYSAIGLYLCVVEFSSHAEFRGALSGVKIGDQNISAATKIWLFFQALGNISFAYSFSMLLIEIQDTLRSPPPENKTMKKASMYGIASTTVFYISLGCMGYAAFGDDTPGNILTGFNEPFWLIDIANFAVIVHLVGAYQIFAQPLFAFYEQWLAKRFPNSTFFNRVYSTRIPFSKSKALKLTLCKLILRTSVVILTTVVAMLLPFFNAILGLLGSVAFWPLTVYYPVAMYISQAKIKRGQEKWMLLQLMSIGCLFVSAVAIIGSVADIIVHIKHAELFKFEL